MTATIYSLVDPRSDSIVYIGKTVRDIKHRYRSHCSKSQCHNGRLKRILNELRELGLKFECRILEKCNPEDVDAREIFHIAKAREDGMDLCNVLSGGDGPAPGSFSEPVRAAMSRSASRRFAQPGARERNGELIKQANNRPESLEANRKRALKMMSDPARRQAISEKSKARFASPEAREASSQKRKEWLANNPSYVPSNARPVLMTPVSGGDAVQFPSLGAAGRSIGVKLNTVHYAVNKGTSVAGHKFQYATE